MGNSIKLILLSLLLATNAWADEVAPGATLPGLLQWLERDSVELAAMRQEADGAVHRAEAAGALPDPRLRIEWMGADRGGLDPTRTDSTKYTLMQPVPGWGKRDAERRGAQAEAARTEAQRRAVTIELKTQLRQEFAGYYLTQRALELNQELTAFVEGAARLVQTRYENGVASQLELVRAQMEQAALESERLELEGGLTQAQARVNALLNRRSDAELALPATLPTLPAAATLDEAGLTERVRAASPQLAVQQAEADRARSNAELVSRNLQPDFILGVAPVQRGARIGSWDAMIEFNLPLQAAAHSAHRHEAQAMQEAAEARRAAAEVRQLGILRENLAALRALEHRLALLRQRSLPLAELAFKGALAGNQTGKVDFTTLLEARRQLQKTRLEALDIEVAQQSRIAGIERLIGDML